jgi:THO complex subunit 4
VFGPARARLVWSPLHHLWRKPLPPSLPLFSIPFHQTTTCRLAQSIKRRPFVSLRTLLHILLSNASALIFNRLCASFSYAVAPISSDSLDPTPSALLLQLDHEPIRTGHTLSFLSSIFTTSQACLALICKLPELPNFPRSTTPHTASKMSSKLDQSLAEIQSASRKSAGRRRNAPRASRPAAAPVGGIAKSTKPARGAGKATQPTKASPVSGDSKIIVSGLVSLMFS